MTAYCVDLIDEHDAGRILLALLEQIAHAARSNAYEHLDEVRSGNRKEGNAGFAGDRPGEQSLARSRRADQQNALRNAPAQFLKLSRLAQEFDNLLQLFLGFLNAGDI